METKHTPGDWYAKDGQIYPQETGNTLALIPYFDKDNEQHKANQQLIAAAPDLLKALVDAMEIIERLSDEYRDLAGRHANYTKGEFKRLQAAINKAAY